MVVQAPDHSFYEGLNLQPGQLPNLNTTELWIYVVLQDARIPSDGRVKFVRIEIQPVFADLLDRKLSQSRVGRRRKAQTGGYSSGAPAFGYEARDGDLVELEEEQVTVKRIGDLRASGASLRAICSILESEGRSSKRGSTRWQPMAVKRVLDRLGDAA